MTLLLRPGWPPTPNFVLGGVVLSAGFDAGVYFRRIRTYRLLEALLIFQQMTPFRPVDGGWHANFVLGGVVLSVDFRKVIGCRPAPFYPELERDLWSKEQIDPPSTQIRSPNHKSRSNPG